MCNVSSLRKQRHTVTEYGDKMDLEFVVRGWALGFAIAAPVGPIGVLCIQRTLNSGRLNGFVSGLGAATADAFYGFVAAFGLAFVSGFLLAQQRWLALIGGLFLCYLAVRTFTAEPALQPAVTDAGRKRSIRTAYVSTFLLTITNPVTILAFTAIFAGMGLVSEADSYSAAGLIVLGVFMGSASWWLLLSGGVSLLRDRITPGVMRWINRLAGMTIGVFGLVAIMSTLR
ncbi:MAG: LysE family translocator [Caldilineaceae bacterium]|nr:LysE family translocator [Caldilineaceae bacterium]